MNDEQQIDCPENHLQMDRLRAIMHRLRTPGGCPWDAEQTHQSLVTNMIEEAFEAVDAIRNNDHEHMKEELGDVLLQVVFHSEIANESGHFDFDDVARTVSDKLVRRHPHVYASKSASNPDEVLTQWEEIKKAEKAEKGEPTEKPYLHGVGDGLPAMLKAAKLQKKAAKIGFDWPDAHSILPKIKEELAELEQELEFYKKNEEGSPAPEALQDEIGDLLFVIVNLARKLKLNPEDLVDRTNRKFLRRFNLVESGLKEKGLELSAENNHEMERIWLAAKQSEKED